MAVAMICGTGCGKHGAGTSAGSDGKIVGSPSDPPVTFVPKWEPSNRYLFHSQVTASSDEPRPGVSKPIPQGSSLGLDYAITVSDTRSNGSRSLQMELTGVQFECTQGDTSLIAYDSMNKVVGTDGNPLAERLETILGSKILFQLSPSNKVMNVRGINEITARVQAGGTARGQAALRRLLTPQYLRHLIDVTVLPVDPVRVNDSWPGQLAFNLGSLGGSVDADVTYRFRGWQQRGEHKCALVELEGTIKPRGTNTSRGGIASSVESGTIKGKTWFNPEIGLVVESTMEESALSKGTIKFRRTGTNAAPQAYVSNLRQQATVKLMEMEQTKPTS